ncbi:hypothetical protein B0H67DRAFT_578970 [Lasiosphaeris hirsuta]|uniref:Uncharacterized protein n=1 Tax=Lasiosphaeris hirsuta TaxID=260670 RepID=A0AA40DV87_9PEZI|nr:hypothetical protein B0H67DRAFT_578970 [Lasiosphaeris hirsuta]
MPTEVARPTMVQGSISTYRLRKDLLEKYLKSEFPKHADFKIDLSKDGREFWVFETPEALTKKQKDYIDDHVRLSSNDGTDFL